MSLKKWVSLVICLFLWACGDSSSSSGEDGSSSSSTDSTNSAASSSTSVQRRPGLRTPGIFSFGAGWRETNQNTFYFYGLDHLAIWVGDNNFYNEGWEGEMLYKALEIGAVPVIYAYVIAEFGKEQGLDDCDLDSLPNLCTQGSQLIRDHWKDSIMTRYSKYAKGMREYASLYFEREVNPDTLRSIWLIEPDFYQYSVSGSTQDLKYKQEGGGIPDAQMGLLFQEIADTIHAYLPAARISIDISPWIKDMTSWYSHFDLSKIDYAHTSGGRTMASSTYIRSGEAKWATVHALLGKPIIADAGYGTSGTGTGHTRTWDLANNINARIADGVIAVTQMDAALDYVSRLDTIRSQLDSLPLLP